MGLLIPYDNDKIEKDVRQSVEEEVSSIFSVEDTPELRQGVNKVALQLFAHNEKAYHAAVRMMNQYGKAAIVHPTGTGKSYIAFKLIEDNPEKVVIWLSPSEYIFKTQLESLKRNDPDFPLANVHFYTYAKLMCCTQAQLDEIAAQKPAYIILDEFHRAGAECWGESTVALLKLCPDAKLLGLTATNIRYLDNNRDMAEELFGGHIASEMTLGEAIVRGILPAPKYVTTVYQYQKELARYQTRINNLRSAGIQDVNQKYLDALRRTLEKADGLDKVFAHHITNKSGKYIVFCANKEHMDEMVSHVPEWFAGVNPDVAVYEAYSDDPGTDRAFADFKADQSKRLKLLFCIDILYIYGCYMKERGKLLTNTVVTTVMSNFGLYKAFDEKGIGYAKTAVGDKYVYEYMAKNGCRIGGEQSGHIIFSKYASTGDGILTSLKMMEVMLAKKKPMSELAAPLKIYPQVLENVRVTDKKAAQNDPAVQEAVKNVTEALGDTGRILVRESGTEPVVRVMVEAPDHDTCQKYVDEVVNVICEKGYKA